MKKIVLFLMALQLYAGEYQVLHDSSFINEILNGNNIVSKSQKIVLSKDASSSGSGWYVAGGWQNYKVFIPAGVSYAEMTMLSYPNASYRVHVTFEPLQSKLVDHAHPITVGMSSTIRDTNTYEFLAVNANNFVLDTSLINSANGGWVYISVVEDSANITSFFGDVNPDLTIGYLYIVGDMNKFRQWYSSANFLATGLPEDELTTLTIIDKNAPGQTTTRLASLDKSVDPNIDKDGDGYSPNQGDCNDYDASVYPNAHDIPNDGIDQDCLNGDAVDLTILDRDGDGYTPVEGDCNDLDYTINPGMSAIPNNGKNDNCAHEPAFEFVSLHPSDLLTHLDNSFHTSASVTINKNVSISAVLSGSKEDWYGNNWQHYKFFIPKGIDSARVVTSSTDNSDFRVHAAFKANHNTTLLHASPVKVVGSISDRETYEILSNDGIAEFTYNPMLINAYDGGYVYLGIANNPNAPTPSSVNFELIMTMNNRSVFDTWKLGVNVLHDDFSSDGNPEDGFGFLYIHDQGINDQVEIRSVPMTTSTLPWSLYANRSSSSSSSSSTPVSNNSSSCSFWEVGCGGGTSSSYGQVSSYSSVNSSQPYYPPVQSSAGAVSSNCSFWESSCGAGSSSTANVSSSSAPSGAVDVSIDNGIVKENLSGKVFQLIGVFSEYDFDRDGKIDPFDWLYKDSVGFAKLRGNEPTTNNVFGWKDINFEGALVANWYLFPLGVDVDGDGSTKFDWIIISADSQSKQVYKLSGVTENGTFKYSDIIDIDYSFSAARDSITFINLRPGE